MSDFVTRERDGADGVDLREYVFLVASRWPLILGLTIIAGLAALVYSLLSSPTYEASALVVITKPLYAMGFDARMQTQPDSTPPSKALVQLATSDQIVSGLLSTPAVVTEKVVLAHDLRLMLSAQTAQDPSLVTLRVRAHQPDRAAAIANAWAERVVSSARELYGQGGNDVRYFEAQLTQASTHLTAAESALEKSAAKNDVVSLQDELAVLQSTRRSDLSEAMDIRRLSTNVEALTQQIARYDSGARVLLGDELAAWLLQAQAFTVRQTTPPVVPSTPPSSVTGADGKQNANISSGSLTIQSAPAAPIQLQLASGQGGSGTTAGQLRDQLLGLNASLKAQAAYVDNRLQQTGPQVLDLQARIEQQQHEKDRLTSDRDLARDTYFTIKRKLDEARIASQDERGEARVASAALPPSETVAPRTPLNTAGGTAIGLLVGLIMATALSWWRQEKMFHYAGISQRGPSREGAN